jgi:UDPglucose 6-dehydrogenase
VVFLALPTPPGEDGSADLTYILGVAKQLGKIMRSYKVLVDKSTVPVGTAELVKAAVAEHATVPFAVVSNPEFLREGFAVSDFMKPDRVVIGCSDDQAAKIMESLYKPFVRQGNPIYFMDEKSAELTKYAANAFLATKITFMNEVANFCELVGADVDKVRIGIGSDSRIGKRFLFPGIGYGGSCFPKDVQALVKSGQDQNYDFQILQAVMAVKITVVAEIRRQPGLLKHPPGVAADRHDAAGREMVVGVEIKAMGMARHRAPVSHGLAVVLAGVLQLGDVEQAVGG